MSFSFGVVGGRAAPTGAATLAPAVVLADDETSGAVDAFTAGDVFAAGGAFAADACFAGDVDRSTGDVFDVDAALALVAFEATAAFSGTASRLRTAAGLAFAVDEFFDRLAASGEVDPERDTLAALVRVLADLAGRFAEADFAAGGWDAAARRAEVAISAAPLLV